MVEYKCFECKRDVSDNYVRRKVRCPYCGSKMIYKVKSIITNFKAR